MSGETAGPGELTPDEGRPAAPAWERVGRLIGLFLPYVTLAVATLLSLLQPGSSGEELGGTVALAALAGVWVYVMYTRISGDKRQQPARMLVYYAGLMALAAALMARQPIFFVFAITGFFHASELRPWPLVFLGVGVTSLLINTLITGFPWQTVESWFIFGTIIVFQTFAFGFGAYFSERLSQVSEQRRQAVARLEAALEENRGLQAQLLAQAREAGILEERQRMAREIHDTLAQGLIGIITQLEAFEGGQELQPDRKRHLENAKRLARESLREARRSVQALRPGPLEKGGLPQALLETAQSWSSLHGVRAEVTTSGDPIPLAPQVEAALLRTAQEALSNVAKHAQASRVGLTLSYMDELVVLDIRDDGVGFQALEPGEGAIAGFGLASMRQRLSQVGGSLEIESEPGGGTAISARVPLLTPVEEVPVR